MEPKNLAVFEIVNPGFSWVSRFCCLLCSSDLVKFNDLGGVLTGIRDLMRDFCGLKLL